MNMSIENIKILVKSISNYHKQGQKPNIFLFSTPRSGSTWLMELIASQKGIKACNEPFNIRKPHIRKALGINDWNDLCNAASLEKIKTYIDSCIAGKLPMAYFDLLPYEKYHQFFTNRIIFKILFTGEDRIEWFQKTFRAEALFLVRHPLPVSLSREVLPRLNSYITSEYRNNFTKEQIEDAKKIIEKGSNLEQAVLDWCFQNAPPLKKPTDTQITITYEQLTLNPAPIINKLAKHLSLEEKDQMLQRISVPSGSVSKSNNETTEFLNETSNYEKHKQWLVEKWKKKISEKEEEKLMDILKIFDLDIYKKGDILSDKSYWIS